MQSTFQFLNATMGGLHRTQDGRDGSWPMRLYCDRDRMAAPFHSRLYLWVGRASMSHKLSFCAIGTPVAQGEIAFFRAALITMAFDRKLDIGTFRQRKSIVIRGCMRRCECRTYQSQRKYLEHRPGKFCIRYSRRARSGCCSWFFDGRASAGGGITARTGASVIECCRDECVLRSMLSSHSV